MTLQHPEFDVFKQAYAQERFDQALRSLDTLISQYPQSMTLHWHRANVLEKLERYAEARLAVEEVLSRKADFVPALIKRVELDFDESELDDEEDENLPEQERERRERASRMAAEARAQRSEQRLRAVLEIDANAVDALRLLSGLLRRDSGENPPSEQAIAEADRQLDRAIALAPARIDLLEERANVTRARAMLPFDENAEHDDNLDPEVVTTFTGMRYSRPLLTRALADFQSCLSASGEPRYALRAASLFHDLGRYEEALAAYDTVLATMPETDPRRAFIVEQRARSENNGAGEREKMARLLESAMAGDGRDRDSGEDMAAHAVLSAAAAIRSGKSVSAAMASRLSDDPDQMMATSIAAQILNVANEPAPGLVSVDPGTFPTYQRKFIDKCKRELAALGLKHVADAEAQGMRLMLGQRVLLGFFADDSGETGVACFAMKPKWPGWIGFLLLLLTGKWKVVEMIECVSQFEDGAHLSTQYVSPSPFEYGAPIYVEKLPRKASLTELVARHGGRVAEYRRDHPHAEALCALDLVGMEQRWVAGQKVKKSYRASIGYVTDKELRGLLGAHYGRFASKVRERLNVLAEDL